MIANIADDRRGAAFDDHPYPTRVAGFLGHRRGNVWQRGGQMRTRPVTGQRRLDVRFQRSAFIAQQCSELPERRRIQL